MSDTTFRTAVEPVAPAAPVEAAPPEAVSTNEDFGLFATYEDVHGKPYTADYLGLENVWDQNDAMKHEIKAIDAYFKKLVSQEKLSNSVKDVKSAIAEYEKKAGVTAYESTNKKIAKLLAYIQFREKVDN